MEAPEMPVMSESEMPKKKTNVWLIVIIVLVVLCCCCVIGGFISYRMLGPQIGDVFSEITNQIY